MKINIGKTAGFCYGVKRAVDGSIEQIKNDKNKKIYCLGELVHNKQVMMDLEEKGIEFIENINKIEDEESKVIIRAHGIEKDVYNFANNKKIKLIDYTCPNVLKIHRIAEKYNKEGYYILLTGTKNHPEIIGTISYCGKNFYLIQTEDDIEYAMKEFEKTNIKKLLVISQTTYSMKKFQKIKSILEEKISKDIDLVIKNTICLATELRQKETKELSQKVDMMIIIGGKNSSNTKKLFEIAKENCRKAICIETKDELKRSEYKDIKNIGIMAGASTPFKSINDIVEVLNK